MLWTVLRYVTGALPGRAAYLVLRSLAGRIQRRPPTPAQQEALVQSSPLRYGSKGRNAARRWGEDGPLVILVHGWAGSAAQLAPLAASIAATGFRCVAMDVTGHGESAGKRSSWSHFIHDIAALARELDEEIHACIAHSAGGLAMMAARHLTGFNAERYICISAPSHPYPPINVTRQRLNPPAGAEERYKRFIAAQFGTDWQALQAGAAYAGAGENLMLVYDDNDRFVNPQDGNTIRHWCPGARLIQTSGYGHTRVLEAPELFDETARFLSLSE